MLGFDSQRWFVYRADGLPVELVWVAWSRVFREISDIAGARETLQLTHDRAFAAIRERTNWTGERDHLFAVIRCNSACAPVFAVAIDPNEAYVGSPVPLDCPGLVEI